MRSDDLSSDSDNLRHKAEEAISGGVAGDADLHELRVHQIELEMQNEELRRAREELDAERKKYFNLFHRAPVGYLTLTGNTIVSDANLTAAHLLGVDRELLIGQPFGAFVFAEDHSLYDEYDEALVRSSGRESCELRLVRLAQELGSEASHFWARLDGQVNPVAGSQELSFSVTFADITERKQAEEALARSVSAIIAVVGQVVALRDP